MTKKNTASMIKEELIFLDKNFESSDALLEFVSKESFDLGYSKESYAEALKKREAEYPTGLQLETSGIAIPHSDSEHLNQEFISLLTLEEPVKFASMEDPNKNVDVDLVFVLGLMDPNDQLATLQEIMGIFQNKEVLDKLKNAKDSTEIYDTLN